MSKETRPSASTGTIERFMDSVKNVSPKEEGVFDVTIDWKGRRISMLMFPDMLASYRDRIEAGKLREFTAAYLVRRDGNKCAIQSSFCELGSQAFARPSSANFDHIDGDRRNHRMKNLRLACHSCNSHLQWKQKLAVASTQVRERANDGVAEELPEVVRTNRANRPLYERWLADNSPVSVYDAIYAGARYLQNQNGNGSPQACRNYLKTVTAGKEPPFIIEDGRVRKA